MKLHLGCGQRYLQGYVNIDFPPALHSVQKTGVADIYSDILALHYPPETVEEVRLHHVFEHFPRPVACAMLASWHSWLVPGGKIHIEVPDLRRMALSILNPVVSFKNRAVAERHLFGSHEAAWAVHYEGYTPDMMKNMVGEFGYKVTAIRLNHWKGTHNFELFAEKTVDNLNKDDLENRARGYLSNFLVDESESEIELLKVWLDKYKKQVDVSWAKNE